MRFGLIGDGNIAKYHKAAIKNIGGEIVHVYDPDRCFATIEYDGYPVFRLNSTFFKNLDYAVICSPSHLHYHHIKAALKYLPVGGKVICEKPAFLPWHPIVDDDRINVIMQLRNFVWQATGAGEIKVQMIRDHLYMDKWQGRIFQSGGFIFNLFIHYIDMAIQHNCRFVGRVLSRGENIRRIDDFDLFELDAQHLFNLEYEKIISGKGNRPADLFYLYWVMNQLIEQCGPGQLGQEIKFDGGKYGI
jgi:predicted dehydrogenase